MSTEKPDELWCLLGKAKAPVVSPFFSRNVLRAIRHEAQDQWSVFGWLLARWQLAGIGVCMLIIASLALVPRSEQPDKTTIFLAKQVSQGPDYQVIKISMSYSLRRKTRHGWNDEASARGLHAFGSWASVNLGAATAGAARPTSAPTPWLVWWSARRNAPTGRREPGR